MVYVHTWLLFYPKTTCMYEQLWKETQPQDFYMKPQNPTFLKNAHFHKKSAWLTNLPKDHFKNTVEFQFYKSNVGEVTWEDMIRWRHAPFHHKYCAGASQGLSVHLLWLQAEENLDTSQPE